MDDIPELLEVLDALQGKAAKWEMIGLQLHLSTDELDIIKADCDGVEERLTRVIRKWQSKAEPRPTWRTIIDALRAPSVGEAVLAKQLGERFAPKVINEPKNTECEASIEVARRSLTQIKQSFATLLKNVAVKLRSKELDLELFRFFIVNLFPPGKCIPHSTNIVTIFEAITENGLWSYWHYVPVEDITKEYAPNDDEVKGWIVKYRNQLSDYKAATSIASAIELYSSSIEEFEEPGDRSCLLASTYDPAYLRRLSVKLKSRVTGKNLEYIDDLWISLAEYFLLPSLSALLENIRKGCLEVSWLVPPHFVFQIVGNLQENTEFLKSKDIVKVCIDRDCVYDETQVDELTERICYAINEGNVDEIVALLTSGVDVNLRLKNGNTLLMVAAYNDKELTEVLAILLTYGADVNLQNKHGSTALMFACEVGHLHAVELLLEHGADTEIKYMDGWTAMMIACYYNHVKIVQLLVEKLANVGVRNKKGQTCLMVACKNGHLDMVQLLLTLPQVDVKAKDESGTTVLMFGSESGDVNIVQVLLKHAKVDVDERRYGNGCTALMYASNGGHAECVKLLLDNHADGNIRNTATGQTAILCASFRGHLQTVKVLLQHEVDLNLQDELGWTPLMAASFKNHVEVVKELLNGGANPDIRNMNGETALSLARACEHFDVVEQLKGCTIVEAIDAQVTTSTSGPKFSEHNIEFSSTHLDCKARLENKRIFREILERGPEDLDLPKAAGQHTLSSPWQQHTQNK